MIQTWHTNRLRDRIGRLSVETVISWMMKISFIFIVPYMIHKGNGLLEAGMAQKARDAYVVAGGAVIALIISLIPSVIARSAQITLPWIVDFLVTLVLYLHVAIGGALGLYYRHDLPLPFDKVLHFFSSIMISLLAFMFVFTLYYTRKIRLSFVFMAVFIALITMGLGGIWEILEYTLDKTAGSRSQTGLDDTMIDMIMDLAGGIAAAIGGALYAKYSKPRHQRRIAIPIAQLMGYIPKPKLWRKKPPQKSSE